MTTAKELRSSLIETYVPLLNEDEYVERAKSFARQSRLRRELVALMLEDLP